MLLADIIIKFLCEVPLFWRRSHILGPPFELLFIVSQVPSTLEVVLVPVQRNGQYPGLFLSLSPARMMRPVFNLSTQTQELIGSFEQVGVFDLYSPLIG